MKVLIPTDFSDNARAAFDFAYKLTIGEKPEFVLLNAFQTPNSAGGMLVSLDEILVTEAVKDLAREKQLILEKYPDVKLETSAGYGPVENAVRRANIDFQIDLVVMGTQGASGIKKVLVGSNAQRVIENVVRPVIAIPEGFDFSSIERILFATDLKELTDREIIKPLCYVAKKFDAHIHILYVDTDTQSIDLDKEVSALELDKWFEERKHSFHLEECDNVVEGIDRFVERHKIDIVVMIPKKTSFFDRLFKRSVTEQFAFQAVVPLLALRDEMED